MHPIIFAVLGFIGLSLAATFLGYFVGVGLLAVDFTRNHPKAAGYLFLGVLGTGAFLAGYNVIGSIVVVVLGLAIVYQIARR